MNKGNANWASCLVPSSSTMQFHMLSYKKIMGFYNGNADWPLRRLWHPGSTAIMLAAWKVYGNNKLSWQEDDWMNWLLKKAGDRFDTSLEITLKNLSSSSELTGILYMVVKLKWTTAIVVKVVGEEGCEGRKNDVHNEEKTERWRWY